MELTDDYTLYDLITKHNKLIKKNIYFEIYIHSNKCLVLEGHKISSLDGDMTLLVLYEVLLMFLTGNNRLEIRVYLTDFLSPHTFVCQLHR